MFRMMTSRFAQVAAPCRSLATSAVMPATLLVLSPVVTPVATSPTAAAWTIKDKRTATG
jgi:hypothetical protein